MITLFSLVVYLFFGVSLSFLALGLDQESLMKDSAIILLFKLIIGVLFWPVFVGYGIWQDRGQN